MTLAIAKKRFIIPANTHFDVYDCVDTPDSPSWAISNLSYGTQYTLPDDLGNISDCYYCGHTKRFGFIQNGTGIIFEYDEDEIVAGTATSPIRTITITGTDSSDTESICDPEPNFLEGGYSVYTTDEGGGANNCYRVEITREQLISTSNISIAVRNQRRLDEPATGNNEGLEGNDRNPFTEAVVAVMEGRQNDNPQSFEFTEPADRDTDYIETDPELSATLTTPFDSQALLTAGHDQSSISWHLPTNTLLVLSDLGNRLYHIQRGTPGTVLGQLDLAGQGLGQIECSCFYGDGVLVAGETGGYMILGYSA